MWVVLMVVASGGELGWVGWERFLNYVQFQAKNGDCVKFLHAFCGAEESLFGGDVPEFVCNSS